MKGLDLSKLKKISSDDKTTTFRHGDGHEVRIAHAALSPKMLKELQAIGGDQPPQKMAEGGEPNPDSGDSPQKQAPVVINVGGQGGQGAQQAAPAPMPSPAPQASPQDASVAPDQSAPQATDPAAAPAAPDASAQAPQAQVVAPDQSQDQSAPDQDQAPQVPSAGQILSQPTSANDALAHLNDETAKLRQDFNNGIITPETYHDLFAKKSTLGKIGLIFGLLMSGAGSGLAHQQNAALGMMDKEIDRDLEAQKQTKTNQFNALNLAETHYKNEISNSLTAEQTKGVAANNALIAVNTDLAKTNKAKTALEFAAEQDAIRRAGLIPPNTPGGQRARAAVGVMSNAITAQQAQRNQRVAQQIEANGRQAQQSGPGSGGYILSSGATPDKIQALTGPYNPTLSETQKGAINDQYKQVQTAESAISQIEKLFPELKEKATKTDVYGKTLSKVPWVGNSAENFLDNITGGNQQRQFKTGKDALSGYITNTLTQLGMTPTDAASAADSFTPAYGDDEETYNGRLNKLKDKIISMATAKSPALAAAGLLKKR